MGYPRCAVLVSGMRQEAFAIILQYNYGSEIITAGWPHVARYEFAAFLPLAVIFVVSTLDPAFTFGENKITMCIRIKNVCCYNIQALAFHIMFSGLYGQHPRFSSWEGFHAS